MYYWFLNVSETKEIEKESLTVSRCNVQSKENLKISNNDKMLQYVTVLWKSWITLGPSLPADASFKIEEYNIFQTKPHVSSNYFIRICLNIYIIIGK